MRAQVVPFDGFDPLDVIGPYETLTAYRASARGGRRSHICGQLAGADRAAPSCPQIAEWGLDSVSSRPKSEPALCGGLPPGWAGPRRGRLSRPVEREIGAQKALDVETLFAHERRGTAWRAA